MIIIEYSISDKMGLHARPAGELVKFTKGLSSKITIIYGEKEIQANRLFGIMGLGVKYGEKISLKIEGENEIAESTLLRKFCEENI